MRFLLGWVHTCNVTVYRNTVSWQYGRDSWPRNVSKVGYAVTLRACSVCCRYLAVASKGWYGYGLSRCGRATWRCTSTPALCGCAAGCVALCGCATGCVALCGCATGYAAIREEQRLRAVDSGMLREVFVVNWQGNGENSIIRSFVICIPQILLGRSNKRRWDGRGMWHACVKREKLVHKEYSGKKKTVGKRQLGRPRRRRKDNIRTDVEVTVGLWKGTNLIDLA
jgi:hypothetical protein